MEDNIFSHPDIPLILEYRDNNICADCEEKKNIFWCSINNGVFLCVKCARIHKKILKNFSIIKSLEADLFSEYEINLLKKGGNMRFNNLMIEYNIPITQDTKEYKYQTIVSDYYRKLLHSEVKGININIVKPSLEKGLLKITNEMIYENLNYNNIPQKDYREVNNNYNNSNYNNVSNYNNQNNYNINNYNTYNGNNYKRPISQQPIVPKEIHKQLNETWSLFPKYFLFFNSDNYKKGLEELVLLKKNFFLFMYGSHNYSGESWCSDCRKSEPFINNAKQTISSREKIKEIYFVSIPIDKEKKMEFYSNPICHMNRVPTLAYFEGGKEKGRIFEQQMQTQQMIDSFIEIAYL